MRLRLHTGTHAGTTHPLSTWPVKSTIIGRAPAPQACSAPPYQAVRAGVLRTQVVFFPTAQTQCCASYAFISVLLRTQTFPLDAAPSAFAFTLFGCLAIIMIVLCRGFLEWISQLWVVYSQGISQGTRTMVLTLLSCAAAHTVFVPPASLLLAAAKAITNCGSRSHQVSMNVPHA